MKKNTSIVLSFSLIFVYLLSIQFEGSLLLASLRSQEITSGYYMAVSMWSHFFGLVLAVKFIREYKSALKMININFIILISSIFFYLFDLSRLWYLVIFITGLSSGLTLISFAYVFQSVNVKNRQKVIIYSLIVSNALLAFVCFVDCVVSLKLAYLILLAFLILARIILPKDTQAKIKTENDTFFRQHKLIFLKLWVFVFAVTIISGLMYAVIHPGYRHIKFFEATWVFPYILVLFIMSKRTQPLKVKYLYASVFMMLFSFLLLLLLKNTLFAYILVNGMLLFALGILDFFWWTIMSLLLEKTKSPERVFSFILSANVLGILVGEVMGVFIFKYQLSQSNFVIILLVILLFVITMSRPLVDELSKVLYENVKSITVLEPFTKREEEVFALLIEGLDNPTIAKKLSISENTVKTHVRNVLSKADVKNRVELLSKYVNHP